MDGGSEAALITYLMDWVVSAAQAQRCYRSLPGCAVGVCARSPQKRADQVFVAQHGHSAIDVRQASQGCVTVTPREGVAVGDQGREHGRRPPDLRPPPARLLSLHICDLQIRCCLPCPSVCAVPFVFGRSPTALTS